MDGESEPVAYPNYSLSAKCLENHSFAALAKRKKLIYINIIKTKNILYLKLQPPVLPDRGLSNPKTYLFQGSFVVLPAL